MRILLDECVDQRLRHLFNAHDCQTAGFEVMITTDQELPYHQNLVDRRFSVVILCAPTNRLSDLQRLGPAVLRALDSIKRGQVLRVE